MGFCNCSMFCCALLCVHSSFAINSMGKRELVALVCLFSWFPVIVVWLFLTMPQVCLQFVIVVFPDYTRLILLAPKGIHLDPKDLSIHTIVLSLDNIQFMPDKSLTKHFFGIKSNTTRSGYKPSILLMGHWQTVQNQTRRRKTQRLTRFSTVCLQKFPLKSEWQ